MKIFTSLNSINKGQGNKGSPLFQYLAALTATLVIITSGMHYGWPSPSLPKLKIENTTNTFTINNDEGSWIAVMPLIGAVLGSIMVASTVDILGRKNIIIMSTFPFLGAWIMIAFTKSSILLNVARFIAGVADGWVFTSVPMYIGEIADPNIRGLLGSSVSVTWIFGILLINIIGSYLSIMSTALISSILPLITLLTFIWMPESPYYLLMRKQDEKARESLQILRGTNDIDSELERVKRAVKAQTENTGKFFDLFTTKSNRRAVYIMMILRGAQQLSGTTAFTFYALDIFQEAGENLSSEVSTIIYFSVQLLLATLCSSIVDKAGRRPLLIFSITGSAIALLLEGIYFYLKNSIKLNIESISFLSVICLIGFVIVFSSGMQSIPILMLGELFPANVKASALCLADIYFCIIATIVSKFFQIMKDSFGIYVPFFVFSLCCLGGLILIILFVPETKGKSLEEIQRILGGKTGDENIDNTTTNTTTTTITTSNHCDKIENV